MTRAGGTPPDPPQNPDDERPPDQRRPVATSGPADSELVRAFAAGDTAAFERLVERYEQPIRRLAFGFVRDHALAEDIAQETFVRAFRRIRSLAEPSSFRSWLFSIALNGSRDELRRRAKFAAVDDLDSALRDFRGAMSGERRLESREAGRWLARLIAELPERQREPLLLKEASGMTYAEIAVQLGVPMGTVQIRIHRARLKLRQQLTELGLGGSS